MREAVASAFPSRVRLLPPPLGQPVTCALLVHAHKCIMAPRSAGPHTTAGVVMQFSTAHVGRLKIRCANSPSVRIPTCRRLFPLHLRARRFDFSLSSNRSSPGRRAEPTTTAAGAEKRGRAVVRRRPSHTIRLAEPKRAAPKRLKGGGTIGTKPLLA